MCIRGCIYKLPRSWLVLNTSYSGQETPTSRSRLLTHKVTKQALFILMCLGPGSFFCVVVAVHLKTKVLYCHLRLNEEPLTSKEPFHCTKALISGKSLFRLFQTYFTPRIIVIFMNCSLKASLGDQKWFSQWIKYMHMDKVFFCLFSLVCVSSCVCVKHVNARLKAGWTVKLMQSN